ncbi:ABC transporter integral membrane domain protein, partial [Chlamydia psittaci 84-8471/1]
QNNTGYTIRTLCLVNAF